MAHHYGARHAAPLCILARSAPIIRSAMSTGARRLARDMRPSSYRRTACPAGRLCDEASNTSAPSRPPRGRAQHDKSASNL
jgi:hypothetical protein